MTHTDINRIMSFPSNSLVHKNQLFLIDLLQAASLSRNILRKRLLQSTDEEIESLVEIMRNCLIGNFPSNHWKHSNAYAKEYIKRLKKYSNFIRNLSSTVCTAKYKRRQIVKNQKGGALLTSLLIPIVGSLLSGLIAKKL